MSKLYNGAKKIAKKTADFLILDDYNTIKTALNRGKYSKDDLKASARLGIKGVGAAALSTAADTYANMHNLRETLYNTGLYIPGLTMQDLQNYGMSMGIQPGAFTDAYSTAVGSGLLLLSAGTYLAKRKSKKNDSDGRTNLSLKEVYNEVKNCPVSAATAILGLAGAAGIGSFVDKYLMYGSSTTSSAVNASISANATNAPCVFSNATNTSVAVNATNASLAANASNGSSVMGLANPFYVKPFPELFAAAGAVALGGSKGGGSKIMPSKKYSNVIEVKSNDSPSKVHSTVTEVKESQNAEKTYTSTKKEPMNYKEYYSTYMRN
ncbi:MAG: hypothetical protein ABIF85_07495 [Nanoarchaeota archaeon]